MPKVMAEPRKEAALIAEAHMKKLIWLGVVTLLIGMTTTTLSGGQDRVGSDGIRERFIGAWRLVSLEAPAPGGKIHKADSTGLFVFTRDGHASVQVMERNPSPQTAVGPEQYSHGGYEATFGTYEVDENAHTFTFQRRGCVSAHPDRQRSAAFIRILGQATHREVGPTGGTLESHLGTLLDRLGKSLHSFV